VYHETQLRKNEIQNNIRSVHETEKMQANKNIQDWEKMDFENQKRYYMNLNKYVTPKKNISTPPKFVRKNKYYTPVKSDNYIHDEDDENREKPAKILKMTPLKTPKKNNNTNSKPNTPLIPKKSKSKSKFCFIC
jgi:hypothetical protein